VKHSATAGASEPAAPASSATRSGPSCPQSRAANVGSPTFWEIIRIDTHSAAPMAETTRSGPSHQLSDPISANRPGAIARSENWRRAYTEHFHTPKQKISGKAPARYGRKNL